MIYQDVDFPSFLARLILFAVLAVALARPQFYSGYGSYASGYPGYYGYSGYSGYSNPLSYGSYGAYGASPYNYGYGYY
ncbi:hypothetical protein HF086_016239 [Spodoptera exigua]|uniref:Uncharacterized protein n=1 Tax=Spodoptera exigua TaxID=7107 RepID=A0A922SG82_SPOEX|nr:hypothetical protein HF086_016239 [Spodoptera exigua]